MDQEPTQIPPVLASTDQLWYLEIIIGLLVLIALNYVFKKIVKHLRQRSLSTTQDWREKLDHICFLPVHILLWILGGILVLEVTARRFDFSFFDGYLSPFRTTAVICCIAWVLLRWKKHMQHSILEKDRRVRKFDPAFVHVVDKVFSIAIILITAMTIMQLWGLGIGPIIAFGGIGAAAVGFSSKDVIANFFGGLMIYITRPFMIGDTILLPDRNLEGQVEEIGWYMTSIRDKEKRPVYLPNAIFSTGMVINGSRMTHRRIYEKIGIRVEDMSKIKAITEEVRHVIASHPEVDAHLPVLVHFFAFSEYSLELQIDVYTLAIRYEKFFDLKQEILMLIHEAVQSKGAEMSYPVMVVRRALQQVQASSL